MFRGREERANVGIWKGRIQMSLCDRAHCMTVLQDVVEVRENLLLLVFRWGEVRLHAHLYQINIPCMEISVSSYPAGMVLSLQVRA